MTEELKTKEFPTKSWQDLLVSSPPGGAYAVPDLYQVDHAERIIFKIAAIAMFCGSEHCGGMRFFDGESETRFLFNGFKELFVGYKCRNCQSSQKIFALLINAKTDSNNSIVLKIGEFPAFGPYTPSRVISLVGPDREMFLKGRRAETLGLGIGAFAYYRRVIENQKGRLIDEISKVSKRLGVDAETIASFEKAKNETQFSRAIDDVKNVMPQSLLVRGHNPLSLLHGALSEGIHAQTDEECLEIATSIRVVLTELAERISQALKDDAELTDALNKLLNPSSK